MGTSDEGNKEVLGLRGKIVGYGLIG